ncbi:ABC transporter permease [Streptomyces sp. CRN 30]|uniref:ABC transporter permease n=1 Tax=Streptomyces sp. CRN 30 TaxID=3075613 RepID=UPI002A7EE267|nr:ABC transporter permease [Streptomyces sp. CRN 30]
MSAVIEETPAAVREAETGGARAVFALARFEARRLLLSKVVLVCFVLYAALVVWRTPDSWDGFPALQNADRATQNGPLLIGFAVLLGANAAALRSRRYGTEAWFGALVVSAGRRTAAHLLSLVPVVLLTVLFVAWQFTWEALKPGAIGSGSPAELAVGPLTVLLLGAAGVLLARLVRSVWAGPLAGALYLLTFVAGPFPTGGEDATWLSPVVPGATYQSLPSDLLGRPAAWHALYLTGLALFLAFLAVLVSGGRSAAVKAGVAVTLAMGLTGAYGQTGGESAELIAARKRVSLTPETEQRCVERNGSRYCAFDEWLPRTEDWAEVVDEVRSLAGGSAHSRPLLVRQRIDLTYGLDSDTAIDPVTRRNQVTVGTDWGGNRVPEFSAAVASVLVAGSEEEGSAVCDGRMVTVMWLALAWQDDPVSALSRVRLDDSVEGAAVVLSPTEPMEMAGAHTEVVRRLLEKDDRDGVAEKVRAHWDELTTPGVTTARAAELLEIPGPVEADECEG